jgi:diaminopimelate decarboxylase
VLAALRGEVDGLDVASGGELERALAAGFPGEALSFAGPGKTAPELELAVARGAVVSAESPRELEQLASLTRRGGRLARVRLRVNPVRAVHAYRVRMVGGPSPFGIDEEALPAAAALLAGAKDALALEGVHVHPGGQCTSPGGVAAAAAGALDVAERLAQLLGAPVPSVNLGGGFGVLAPGDELDVEATGRKLAAMLDTYAAATGHRPTLLVEPGRWLAAPAGVYVARVVSEKVSRGVHFVVLDGGLHQHLGATGHLAPGGAPRLPVVNLSRPGAPVVTRTLVGPLCTPLDTFGEMALPEPRVGDLVGVLGSGAYGYSFSPLHFLGHPLPAEVLLG